MAFLETETSELKKYRTILYRKRLRNSIDTIIETVKKLLEIIKARPNI